MLKNMDEAAAAVGQMSTLYQACMMCAFGGRIDGIDKYEDLKEQVRYFGIVVFNTCMPSPFALHSSYLDICVDSSSCKMYFNHADSWRLR